MQTNSEEWKDSLSILRGELVATWLKLRVKLTNTIPQHLIGHNNYNYSA